MKEYIEERVLAIAAYILENKATVRRAAGVFKYSKSTVHKDMSERLPALDKQKALRVHEILEQNKAERHIRGGRATKMKYLGV